MEYLRDSVQLRFQRKISRTFSGCLNSPSSLIRFDGLSVKAFTGGYTSLREVKTISGVVQGWSRWAKCSWFQHRIVLDFFEVLFDRLGGEGLSCSPFQIVGKYAARSAKKGSISYALLSVFSCSSYLLNLIVLSLYYLALRFFCLFNLLANFRLFEVRLILVLLWFFEYWAKKKKVICKFNVLSASTSLLGFEDGMFLIWKKRKKLRRNWRDLNFYHVYALPRSPTKLIQLICRRSFCK